MAEAPAAVRKAAPYDPEPERRARETPQRGRRVASLARLRPEARVLPTSGASWDQGGAFEPAGGFVDSLPRCRIPPSFDPARPPFRSPDDARALGGRILGKAAPDGRICSVQSREIEWD